MLNPDQRLVVTYQPTGGVFLDAVRDLVLAIDELPGLVESLTHLGRLVAGTTTRELPRTTACSWTLFSTTPRLDQDTSDTLCATLDRTEGVMQVAQLAGRLKIGIIQMFEKDNVAELIRSQQAVDESVAQLTVQVPGDAAVALQPVTYDEMACEVCP